MEQSKIWELDDDLELTVRTPPFPASQYDEFKFYRVFEGCPSRLH